MKKLSIYSIASLMTLFLTISCHYSQVLFQENSKTWEVTGDASWEFSQQELVGKVTEGAGYVVSKQAYKDFILELEFKPDSTINSGVFIRCKNNDINPTNCYELNIWDLHPNQDSRTGAIVTKTKPLTDVNTINKWNTYIIKAEKNSIQVWVNHTLTADMTDDGLTEGYIGLQAKLTGEVRFRNVKITPLKVN